MVQTREHTPGSLVRYMAKKWKRKVKVLRFTDDDNKYDAKEVSRAASRCLWVQLP